MRNVSTRAFTLTHFSRRPVCPARRTFEQCLAANNALGGQYLTMTGWHFSVAQFLWKLFTFTH